MIASPLHAITRRSSRSARYRVGERIASGGMGGIYRAHDMLREREVAFKRLVVAREPLRAHMTALFEREFHTLAQLSHPGIVEAYDYGIDAEGPYYTMELLAGSDLRVGMPLAPVRACALLCEVASALALVHARRLVHRDLSSANVFLTSSGHAKLIDFGALATFGRPKQIVGTPAFIAPESVLQGEIDHRADLYALGALAYWMLTGRHAVQARELIDLGAAWARETAPPSRWVRGLPAGLDELVMSLLQHDPLARPASAAYVIDRLGAITNRPLEEEVQRVSASYVAYPPLVGRSKETGKLEAKLSECAHGSGHAVWVEALQGTGRSALLDHLALHAQLTGATVLRAQGGEGASALSLACGLVAAALRTHPDLRRFCEDEHPSMTAFCLREGREEPPSPRTTHTPATAAEDYAQLLAGMHDVLLELSRLNPLVLVIDDVQRADPESAGLLASLAHEASHNSLLVVVSAATDEPTRGAPALAKLRELAQRLTLSALNESDVAELVSTIFGAVPNSRRLARWLHAQCHGHPQHTVDLLRLLLRREIVRYRGGLFSLPYDVDGELGAPELGQAPVARVNALAGDARSVAELLCIEEEALELSVLRAALGLTGPRLFAAIEALVAQAIARKLGGKLTLASRPLRAALATTLGAEQRSELHLQLARALLTPERTIDHTLMAGLHLLRGGCRDEGAALLASTAHELVDRAEGIAKAVPALQLAFEVFRAQGRSDEACLGLLVPLTIAGFYGDPRLSARYLERTYRALLRISGATLAQRLSRYVGGKPALLIGLAYSAYFYFLRLSAAQRPPRFSQLFTSLFSVASAGAAATASAYETEQCVRIGARLAPFAVLGSGSAVHVVRELSTGLAEIVLSAQASVAARMARLTEVLAGPRKLAGLNREMRTQLQLGAVYLRGVSEVYAGNPVVLELASQLDASGSAFSKPRAALLRMCHFGFRGEQDAADSEGGRAEVLALLGGTSWSAMSAMAIRRLLVFQWTRDSVGLLRVVNELEDLTAIAPALGTHRELARAYLELLRGRPASALETYERVLDAPRKYPVTNWQPEAAHRAQALNALGRHAEARDVCLAVVSQTSDEDLRMRFLYQPAQQELALSEARLGQIAEAEARLDRLIAEVGALDNPLLSGCLHRDRGRVALLANDGAAFALHLAHTAACFQRTQNPCLIQQYGVLAAQGASVGFRDARMEAPSDNGRAHSRRPLGPDARFGLVERRSDPPDSAITQLERPGSPDTLTTLVDDERARR